MTEETEEQEPATARDERRHAKLSLLREYVEAMPDSLRATQGVMAILAIEASPSDENPMRSMLRLQAAQLAVREELARLLKYAGYEVKS